MATEMTNQPAEQNDNKKRITNSSPIGSLRYDDEKERWIEDWDNRKLQDILDFQIKDEKGTYVFFLPMAEYIGKNKPLSQQLSQKFHIPRWFWKKQGWDANAFCYSDEAIVDGEKYYSSFSRFLYKEVGDKLPDNKPGFEKKEREEDEDEDEDEGKEEECEEKVYDAEDNTKKKGYTWQFLAFTTLCSAPKHGVSDLKILLCFDLSAKNRGRLTSEFEYYSSPSLVHQNAFLFQEVFVGMLGECFDDALWRFRKPIRKIEKARKKLDNTTDPKKDCNYLDRLVKNYHDMHELSRHIIHFNEVVETGRHTLQCILEYVEGISIPEESPDATRFKHRFKLNLKTKSTIKYVQGQLYNLQKRCDSFETRLHNEINMRYHTIAARDSATQIQILHKTQQAENIAKTVSFMTLAFLPGTFISGLFGTNFFVASSPLGGTTSNNVVADNPAHSQLYITQNFWIFFLITVPVTLLGFAVHHWIGPIRKLISKDKTNEFSTSNSDCSPISSTLAKIGSYDSSNDSPSRTNSHHIMSPAVDGNSDCPRLSRTSVDRQSRHSIFGPPTVSNRSNSIGSDQGLPLYNPRNHHRDRNHTSAQPSQPSPQSMSSNASQQPVVEEKWQV